MQLHLDRRGFLIGVSSSLALGSSGTFGRRRAAEGRALVLVQLSGGNDGLSTVVPYGDDAYARARGPLRIAPDAVLRLDERRGLHPALGRLAGLFERGSLAIVEGAGYPRPNRSHFESFEIWHTADTEGRASGEGWIGRLCRVAWEDAPDANRVVHIGPRPPYSLHSSQHPPVSFTAPELYGAAGRADALERLEGLGGAPEGSTLAFLRDLQRDARVSSRAVREATQRPRKRVEYPDSALGRDLACAAALIEAGIGTRIVSVELDGFDTHSEQRGRHDRLMATLDAGLGAFMDDLAGSESGREALVLVFSEFGRRVAENGSGGTDHGCAGPMLVLGSRVRGGFHGAPPSLAELDEGDLVFTTDFRRVYGKAIEHCFGVPHERVLGASYPLLELT